MNANIWDGIVSFLTLNANPEPKSLIGIFS